MNRLTVTNNDPASTKQSTLPRICGELRGNTDGLGPGRVVGRLAVIGVDLHRVVTGSASSTFNLIFLLEIVLTLVFEVHAALVRRLLLIGILVSLNASHLRILARLSLLFGQFHFGGLLRSLLLSFFSAVLVTISDEIGFGLLRREFSGSRCLGVPKSTISLVHTCGGYPGRTT
jgi:hypothetical protein